jgi:hypothetical protein
LQGTTSLAYLNLNYDRKKLYIIGPRLEVFGGGKRASLFRPNVHYKSIKKGLFSGHRCLPIKTHQSDLKTIEEEAES